ncbi:MAG TPA: hypothetical protein VNI02_09900 [Blastocatellia bacterium]|nr:hypothetical protein [Blastocatellia bacterium]
MYSTGLAEGRAGDQDAPQVSIKVQIVSNNNTVEVFRANVTSDATTNSQCGWGTAYRFSAQLPSWTKGQTISTIALDTMQGTKALRAESNAGCTGVSYCTS